MLLKTMNCLQVDHPNPVIRAALEAFLLAITACATGITDYFRSEVFLAETRKMANRADTRTMQLYDWHADRFTRWIREGEDSRRR